MISEPASGAGTTPSVLGRLCLAIIEHAPLPMATVEGAAHLLRYVNPAFCLLMKEPAETLVGRPLSQFLPDNDQCLLLLDRVFRDGTSESFTAKDSSESHPIFWSYTMWPVLAHDLLVGVMIQVTETAEFHGLKVSMNEALMLGSVRQHELIEAAARVNKQLEQEVAAHDKTAQQLAEKARLVELLLAQEKTSRLDAEAANRAKDLFLATLSHEVRTPLNAILGWASIIRGGKCSSAEALEGMEVIERNCRTQAQLIEDVLDVSSIVAGNLRLEIRACDLAEVIKAAIDVVRPAADAKGIRIISTLDATASHASCDMHRMQQVVWNLLVNAIKFTPAGRIVRITLVREGSVVKIMVSDEGQGISASFLPFVFDRFRQADGGTRRKFGGLGLGLSIVKHIVEQHEGSVSVESAGIGHGSTFTVELPLKAVPREKAQTRVGQDRRGMPPPEVTFPRLDGLRILVVDDEPDACRLLNKVLEDAGARVTAVTSVPDALVAVAAENPQVLLSDIAMPGEDGYDLMRHIRTAGRTSKDLPAVALTAFAHKDDRMRVLLAGFQVHMAKPIDPHELIAVVASLAGRTG